MEPTKTPWATAEAQAILAPSRSADQKLPMEPTKAPWALDGQSQAARMPPAGAICKMQATPEADRCQPASAGDHLLMLFPGPSAGVQHHERERGYLTGHPVAEVVLAKAHMPAPGDGARGGRGFVVPQKCIHNKADLDRC